MHTGGMLDANGAATGKAGVLNNHSATIEAAGYLVLSAGQINNVNDHFTTERVVVSTEKVTEYQLSGSDKRWSAGEPGVYVDNDSSNSLKNCIYRKAPEINSRSTITPVPWKKPG